MVLLIFTYNFPTIIAIDKYIVPNYCDFMSEYDRTLVHISCVF